MIPPRTPNNIGSNQNSRSVPTCNEIPDEQIWTESTLRRPDSSKRTAAVKAVLRQWERVFGPLGFGPMGFRANGWLLGFAYNRILENRDSRFNRKSKGNRGFALQIKLHGGLNRQLAGVRKKIGL